MGESGKSRFAKFPPLAAKALSASLLLAGFMVYATSVWSDKSFSFPFTSKIRWTALLIFAGGMGGVAALARQRLRRLLPATPMEAALMALGAGMAVLLFSSGAAHPWFFMARWFSAGVNHRAIPLSIPFSVLTVAGAFFLVLLRPRTDGRDFARVLIALLALLQIASFAALLHHTGGAAIYRDDHPSFMFRIREFTQTYPHMAVFNPWWNAGVVNAVGASSGVEAVALPLFPLWRAFPPHLVYTPLIGLLFIFVNPLMTMVGLRAARASWTAALTGAILSLGVSRAVFVWGLHFGTVGAIFSMSFLPPFAMLLYRAFVLRRTDAPTLIGLLATAFILMQWPPCVIPVAALLFGCLLNIQRISLRVVMRLALVALVLAILLIPNIAGLLASRDLFHFVADNSAASPSATPLPPIRDWLRAIPALLVHRLPETHPIVTIMGLGGLAALPHRRLRRLLAPATIGLLMLAAWAPIAAPRLQLERMALPALMLAAIPAALLAGKAFNSTSPRLGGLRALLATLLLLGGVTVAAIYKGEGYAPYTTLPPEVEAFANTVRREVPPDGRLLFYGATVHSFGGGHVAYLPVLTGREMMACDYYHFPPKMVEYDYPPLPWRRTAEGIADFMRLHGATHMATTMRRRADFIRESGLFDEIAFMPDGQPDATFGIALFALKDAVSGRVLEGEATVDASFGHLRVTPGTTREAVIRYVWNPLLTANGTADITPAEVAPGVTFIRVAFHGSEPAVIRYGRGGK